MRLALGLDIGGTKIAGGLVSAEGDCLVERRCPTPADDPAAIVTAVVQLARDLLAHAPVAPLAVGLAAPGSVDSARGVCREAANLPWRDLPLAPLVAEALGRPAFLENDTNAAALAEYTLGAGRGCRHFLYVALGTGIGAGIIADGRLYRGAHGEAGEIGHTIVAVDGPPCRCGARGCLETQATGRAMVERARMALAAGQRSTLSAEDLTVEELLRAAAAGDPVAQTARDQTLAYLAAGLVSLFRLFDPERLAIGGGLAQAGDWLLAPLRAAMARQHAPRYDYSQRVVPAALGHRAGVIGAALVALDHLTESAPTTV